MSETNAELLMGHTMRYGGAYDHIHDFELLEEYGKAENQMDGWSNAQVLGFHKSS